MVIFREVVLKSSAIFFALAKYSLQCKTLKYLPPCQEIDKTLFDCLVIFSLAYFCKLILWLLYSTFHSTFYGMCYIAIYHLEAFELTLTVFDRIPAIY